MKTPRSSVQIFSLGLLLFAGCGPGPAAPPPGSVELAPGKSAPAVMLDGRLIPVNWDDGDTFATPDRKLRARLVGYNTLESYGPVHRWGEWTPAELHKIAKDAGLRAASEVWTCTTEEGGGGYGRAAVDCPGLRQALLREGLAHTFAIDGSSDPADQAIQAESIAAGSGMWAKGAPEGLVTSVHSLDERDGASSTYDRVCSTTTGAAPKVIHAKVHPACTEVCHQGSCLLYVPYAQRYGDDRAACLR